QPGAGPIRPRGGVFAADERRQHHPGAYRRDAPTRPCSGRYPLEYRDPGFSIPDRADHEVASIRGLLVGFDQYRPGSERSDEYLAELVRQPSMESESEEARNRMGSGRAQPDIHLTVRIQVDIGRTQQAGLVS